MYIQTEKTPNPDAIKFLPGFNKSHEYSVDLVIVIKSCPKNTASIFSIVINFRARAFIIYMKTATTSYRHI